MTLLAALCGATVVAGVLLLVAGLRPHAETERPGARRPTAFAGSLRPERILWAVAGGALALVVTRWPVAAAVGALGAWQVAAAVGRPDDDSAARAEAIALWAEILRDALGTSWEIETVLKATAPTAPRLIRADVEAATERLAYVSFDEVLDDLAARLGDGSGDLVVSALRLAGRSGGRQVRDILDSVSEAAYDEADALRRIDVARERPRSSARLVAAIVVVTVVASAVLFRDWLEPYDRVEGQLALGAIAAWCGAAMWWMARMARVDMPARFTARRGALR
jgi:Flp pilus assembly protein TadB